MLWNALAHVWTADDTADWVRRFPKFYKYAENFKGVGGSRGVSGRMLLDPQKFGKQMMKNMKIAPDDIDGLDDLVKTLRDYALGPKTAEKLSPSGDKLTPTIKIGGQVGTPMLSRTQLDLVTEWMERHRGEAQPIIHAPLKRRHRTSGGFLPITFNDARKECAMDDPEFCQDEQGVQVYTSKKIKHKVIYRHAKWDIHWASTLSKADIYNVILGARYLQIDSLFKLGCALLASKAPANLRKSKPEDRNPFEIKQWLKADMSSSGGDDDDDQKDDQ